MINIYKNKHIYDVEYEEEEEENNSSKKEEHTPTWQELAEVDPKEFDTPEKLAKSYKDLRTDHKTRTEKLEEMERYQKNADPVLRLIMQNQDLREHVTAVAEGKQYLPKKSDPEPDKKDKKEDNQPDHKPTEDNDTVQTLRDEYLTTFEKDNGVADLPDDKKAKFQKEFGKILYEINPNWDKLPLSSYKRVLSLAKDTYNGRHSSKETDKSDDLPNVIGGAIGFGSHSPNSKSTGDEYSASNLTPEQRKAAERMHLTPEDYAKELKAIKEGK